MARILIADDREDDRYVLRDLFEAAGHHVEEAVDGAQALARAEVAPPDLIVSDVFMPRMDGFDLCRQWHRNAALQGVPFVFYSAMYTGDEDRALARRLGADDYIIKPQEPRDLLARVEALLATGNGAKPGPGGPLDEHVFQSLHGEVVHRRLAQSAKELQEANRRLTEGEARLRLILEAGAHGTYDLDLETGEGEVNDAYARMLGHDPATFRETLTSFYARMHPDDRAGSRAALEDYTAGRRSEYRAEFRLATAGAGWKWVLSTGAIVEWRREGRPVRLLGTHTDIDARMRAERLLRANAERLSALMGLTADAADLSEEDVLARSLEVVARVTGSTWGSACTFDVGHAEPRSALWIRIDGDEAVPVKPLPGGDTIWRECRTAGVSRRGGGAADGGALPHFYVPVLDAGAVRLVLGVLGAPEGYDDIDGQQLTLTAQYAWRLLAERRARQRHREAEEMYRAVAEQSVAGLVILDGARLLYANPRAEEIFGRRRVDVVGRKWTALLADRSDAEAALDRVHQVQQGAVPSLQNVYRFRRADGAIISVGAHSSRATVDGRPVVLSVIQDITARLEHERERQAQIRRLRQGMEATVEAISRMVEYRDPYTSGHQRKVGRLAARIGMQMGFNETFVESLRIIGYVHDAGKIVAPAEILARPRELTEPELALVRTHAEVGYRILQGIDFPWPVAEAVYQHHERLDGSGYPRGLRGDEILREARIIAVADVVEAMTSHRPYRAALGIEAALAEIREGAGTRYDPEVVAACIHVFEREGYDWE